ncbi:hypothetical protein EYF80_020893 [Liparis tanakae]|uniref:Uncharacterized protein n=1 Tax=Liparis tanakae TaxID=230148 RepID=A0A4Z2HSX7_9TELE|nr:hypothetical protein EYF80_020893 [Liparis tanakae]
MARMCGERLKIIQAVSPVHSSANESSAPWRTPPRQAGLLVKRVCPSGFVEELLFHSHSKTYSTQLANKEAQWKGETAGYSKHVGPKLSRHIGFTIGEFTQKGPSDPWRAEHIPAG